MLQDTEMEVWDALPVSIQQRYSDRAGRQLSQADKRLIAQGFIRSQGGAQNAINYFKYAFGTSLADLPQLGVSVTGIIMGPKAEKFCI
jgi:hypothetical protein